jgi:hypothetical protein
VLERLCNAVASLPWQEVRSMCRLRRLGIKVPTLYYIDAAAGCIYMEQLAGTTLQQLLADSSADDPGACVCSGLCWLADADFALTQNNRQLAAVCGLRFTHIGCTTHAILLSVVQ